MNQAERQYVFINKGDLLMIFIRWVLFVPAGILAGALVQFLYPFLTGIRFEANNFMIMFSALLAGAASIYVSALVAPTEKKLMIAIIMLFISFVNLGVAITYEGDNYMKLITLLQVVGSLFITVQIHRREIVF